MRGSKSLSAQARVISCVMLLMAVAQAIYGQAPVTTWHYDNLRSGVNSARRY